jgi:hypothetical protein
MFSPEQLLNHPRVTKVFMRSMKNQSLVQTGDFSHSVIDDTYVVRDEYDRNLIGLI